MQKFLKRNCLYTYFIQAGVNGPIKIGQANNPGSRLNDLQTSNHEHLKLIGVTEVSERQLHSEFSDCRIRGEWFKPEQCLLDWIKENTKYWIDWTTYLHYSSPEFRQLVIVEPSLEKLLARALSYRHDKTKRTKQFCANLVWYGEAGKEGLKEEMCRLVGWGAEILKSEKDYDIAYDTIWGALPNCGSDCGCNRII